MGNKAITIRFSYEDKDRLDRAVQCSGKSQQDFCHLAILTMIEAQAKVEMMVRYGVTELMDEAIESDLKGETVPKHITTTTRTTDDLQT